MPAIDVAMPATPTVTAEARPAVTNAGKAAKAGASDTSSSEAFIAALLAQSMAPATAPDAAPRVGEGGPQPDGGQELPTLRPALAATGLLRPVTALPTDTPPADAAAVDGADGEFASAFLALQDAMTGGTGGAASEHGPLLGSDSGDSGDSDGPGPVGATGLLSDLASPSANPPARAEIDPGQALDALTGAHAARSHEAPAPAPAYAVKPAPLPMDQPAMFAERLNQHISFMIGDQVQSAQIAVTPADLGPVEVRVTMVGDEAKIQLSATHAATREALNDALPRLRASFADAGISLSQAGVFAQMPERQQTEPAFNPQPRAAESDFETAPVASLVPARNLKIGLIDAFV